MDRIRFDYAAEMTECKAGAGARDSDSPRRRVRSEQHPQALTTASSADFARTSGQGREMGGGVEDGALAQLAEAVLQLLRVVPGTRSGRTRPASGNAAARADAIPSRSS